MVSHQIRPVNYCDGKIPLNSQPIKLHSRDPYSMMVLQESGKADVAFYSPVLSLRPCQPIKVMSSAAS